MQLVTEDANTGKTCYHCGYKRKASDKTAAWRCPRCGVAYNKMANQATATNQATTNTHTTINPKDPLRIIQNPKLYTVARVANNFIYLSLLLLALSYWNQGRLPERNALSIFLENNPRQTATQRQPFAFDYRGKRIEVTPVASYELWGLIASHNNIDGFVWGYDKDDVNIKDICVLWGANLASNDYQHYKIWNKQWTCMLELNAEQMQRFHGDALSNNHLLAEAPNIRKTIRELRVGDQVRIKGMLVNYRTPSFAPQWRSTSTQRGDAGNGACEVVFVEEIDVLRYGTPGWYWLFDFSLWLLLFSVIIRCGVFFLDLIIS
jgi:ribosomal protein L37AE/L43A